MSDNPNRPSAEILRASFELQNIEAAAKKKAAGNGKDAVEDKAAAIKIDAHKLSPEELCDQLGSSIENGHIESQILTYEGFLQVARYSTQEFRVGLGG